MPPSERAGSALPAEVEAKIEEIEEREAERGLESGRCSGAAYQAARSTAEWLCEEVCPGCGGSENSPYDPSCTMLTTEKITRAEFLSRRSR